MLFFAYFTHRVEAGSCKGYIYLSSFVSGRQHLVQMEFCRHEKDALTVVKNGLWPSSTKRPRVAFTMALMELCVELQVNARLSLHAICAALKQAQTSRPLLPPALPSLNLYRVLSAESFNEYRYQRTKLLNLSSAPGFELSCCIPCDKVMQRGCCVCMFALFSSRLQIRMVWNVADWVIGQITGVKCSLNTCNLLIEHSCAREAHRYKITSSTSLI